jgi:crossover junction endodeoxyribonuclease RusA
MTTSTRPTSTAIHFVVPGPPIPKARPRLAPGGHTYTPPRTVEAEARIRAYLKAAYPNFRMLGVDCALHIDVYLKGQARGDWDNFGKLVSDALNRVAYEDDSLIQDARVRKFYDSPHPRTEITLWPLPDVGRSAT